MILSNELKRINGEFSRLNLYSLSVCAGGHYSNLPIFQYSRITMHYSEEPEISLIKINNQKI